MNKTLMRLSLTLMVTVMGASAAIKCHMWRDILPCDCQIVTPQTRTTSITCENMLSFTQVVDLLRGHFHSHEKINLRLERSNLQDLQYRQFREINVTIESIKLNHDYLGFLEENTFAGMSRVTYVSFADTSIDAIPGHLWKYMPNIQTVDLGRTNIKEILLNSFEGLADIRTIVLPGNQISKIDKNSIPLQIQRLHLGRNRIYNLNGTLTGLRDMSWLFLNANEFEDLEGQLPYEASNLKMIHASNNRLVRIPQQLSDYPRLETVFLNNNEITSLDGAIAGCRALERIDLKSNQIHTITATDFLECEVLDTLDLAYNQISTLNHSLLPLKSLETLNLSNNLLSEFCFSEIFGLERLHRLELSYNQISNIVGPASNLVEPNIRLTELKLDHNSLEVLNAALSGLSELLRLDLSYNKLRRISPDDLINLDQLRLLDISHNQLKTLEEMSKTYLPRLSELKATHNQLTILEHDFHGLPVLCDADLSSNQIVALGRDLVTKTRCKLEHGVHDGPYDTLKIVLSYNPILCDAALPEITSEMETNHTKVTGVSYHCPTLDELPITAKPNAYLGYVPEQASPTMPALAPFYAKSPYEPPLIHNNAERLDTPNQIETKIYPNLREAQTDQRRTGDQYQTQHLQNLEGHKAEVIQSLNDQPITSTLHQTIHINQTQETAPNINVSGAILIDPITQGQVINKLASDIEVLKTRIEAISVQNERLFNKTILELEHANLTVKVP
ncbi:leucine-rich repeat protein SHOC-2 [Euwallacea fornicatus]|uniref:leucine-rich repeat protein SHOC-2 n=1 Tax=Euwallacea fornicatus TaxID=995702 RepID=UPI00338DC7AE